MRLRLGIIGAAALCLAAVFASPAVAATTASATPVVAGPHFTFKTFDVPNSTYTDILGINNLGVMVGQYYTMETIDGYTVSIGHGFIAQRNQITTVDVPGSVGTLIQSINDRGIAVGNWTELIGTFPDNYSLVSHGFVRSSSGVITTIDDPVAGTQGYTETVAGINDQGVMVGNFVDSSGVEHGFIYQHGQFTTVDNPKYPATATSGTELWGINNLGVMDGLGYSYPNIVQGLIDSSWMPGSQFRYFTAIGDQGGYASNGGTWPQAINDFGTVVGHSNGWAEPPAVFTGWERLSNGRQIQISDPNASTSLSSSGSGAPFAGTAPGGINDFGVVTGIYWDSNNIPHGFIAYPTP